MQRSAAVNDACERAAAALQRSDPAAALRHYDYALRLAPADDEIMLAIGATCLALQDTRAVEFFASVAERHDLHEARLGLAASHHSLGRNEMAAQHLRSALSRHGHIRGTPHAHLNDEITRLSGDPGWCALSADGTLRVTLMDAAAGLVGVIVLLDDVPLAVRARRASRGVGPLRMHYPLPATWLQAGQISVCLNGRHMIGSPLEAGIITQVEGFVAAGSDGGLTGWAWMPHVPDCAPTLTITDTDGTRLHVVAREPAPDVPCVRPLARPRRLEVTTEQLDRLRMPIAVQDAAGRDLPGSPLDPLAERRSAVRAAERTRRLFPAAGRRSCRPDEPPLAAIPAAVMGVDVVIPMQRGHDDVVACVNSVLASLPKGARCVVCVDPSLQLQQASVLTGMARAGRIRLHRQTKSRGLAAATNVGIRAAGERDIILLSSATLVPPGWIERLAAIAYRAPDIGTATPLCNGAGVFGYGPEDGGSTVPDRAAMEALDRLARHVNSQAATDMPVAGEFCVYLRRDCLQQVGLLREDQFAQGRGAVADFSVRARHLGWRHVAAPGVFVMDADSGAGDSATAQLAMRNMAIINRLHAGFDSLLVQHRQRDPLAPARFRIDALRWRRRRSREGAIVLITHARVGGVKRRVAERCREIAAAGLRPIVLSPAADASRHAVCQLADGTDFRFPHLRFDVSAGLRRLAAFLQGDRPLRVELHHFIGHDPAMLGLADALKVPYDVVVHDYAWICPRITLVGPDKRYCGEPDSDGCAACYSDLGSCIDEDITPQRLQQRSRHVLAKAQRVVVPSGDAASRLRHYFPAASYAVTPWESDATLLPARQPVISRLRRRVVIAGGISIDKGYEYLLACARHVATQRLALAFVVVGYTHDDKRLLDTGVVQITGIYEESEAVELIRAQRGDLGFQPALWPETWSYTLTQVWQAGLDVVAFDLGAPAERIRATGRGSLLPLGVSPAVACRALLAYQLGNEASPTQPFRPAVVA